MLTDDADRRPAGYTTKGEHAEGRLGKLAQATVGRRAVLPREREAISRMPGDEGEQGNR